MKLVMLLDADVHWLREHLTDAQELNTYHDAWNRRAERVLHTLELAQGYATKPAADSLADRLLPALRDVGLEFMGYAGKLDGANRAAHAATANALISLHNRLAGSKDPKPGDGAATPPADPTPTGVATPGEQAAESATGAATPELAPSPPGLPECPARSDPEGRNGSRGRMCFRATGHYGRHLDSQGWWR